MFSQVFIQGFIDMLAVFSGQFLISIMASIFSVALILRSLTYFLMKRENSFIKKLEKESQESDHKSEEGSFLSVSKTFFEKSYHEFFDPHSLVRQKKRFLVTSWIDRVFMLPSGCALLAKDTLTHIKHLHPKNETPPLHKISKMALSNNPYFKRLFAILPIAPLNDGIRILPKFFIMCGILGTFLSLSKSLFLIESVDMTNIANSKIIMDDFILKISLSMASSVVGILFSALTALTNTILNPERVFMDSVERFENLLEVLWQKSHPSVDTLKHSPSLSESKFSLSSLIEDLEGEYENFDIEEDDDDELESFKIA